MIQRDEMTALAPVKAGVMRTLSARPSLAHLPHAVQKLKADGMNVATMHVAKKTADRKPHGKPHAKTKIADAATHTAAVSSSRGQERSAVADQCTSCR